MEANLKNTVYLIFHPFMNVVFVVPCQFQVSEGLDFADINGRAVVITGLPFPPKMDPKVTIII